MTYSLGFTGDVMLGRLVDEHQRRRDATDVWGDLLSRLRTLDGLFVNLECCLSTRGIPYTATYHPFHFRADPAWAIPALATAGVDFLSLSNNHVLDYGEDAFADTLSAIDAVGTARAGAGFDEAEAFAPSVVTIGDLDVALVAFTDNVREWAAGPESPGVAYVEVDHDDRSVRQTVRDGLDAARATDPDLLVASLHWGPNMTEGPDEARRGFGRWLVEEGVDVVYGHSAHVFHGVEVVEGEDDDAPYAGLVLYDTGEFVDDYAIDQDLRNDRSFLFVVEVSSAGELERLRLEPIGIADFAVHSVDESAAAWWHETMRERTERFDLGTEYETDGEALVVEVA